MNESRKYYAMQQLGREAHVSIFGDIATWPLLAGETSGYSFGNEIAALDADVIHVHINSYGGAVSEGWAIYNTLRTHPARIVTHAEGFVASAALYPFMAGDERIASNLSAFFFHQVLMCVDGGNADELRAAADEADKLNEIGLAAFSNAGIDADYIRALEKAETWLSAGEALEAGIATSITADESPREMQSVKRQVMQKIMQGRAESPYITPQAPGAAPNGKQPAGGSESGAGASVRSDTHTNSVMALFQNFKF